MEKMCLKRITRFTSTIGVIVKNIFRAEIFNNPANVTAENYDTTFFFGQNKNIYSPLVVVSRTTVVFRRHELERS